MGEATNRAVFLSYAREDAAAARRIAEALRGVGVEVWFDEDELRGGDSWDAKIRKQIKDCALFVPIISANTQARPEGYFRLEWKLADRRMDLIGKSKAFLLPACIDDTPEGHADVPDSFLAVQWTRLTAGETSAAFCSRVTVLLHGEMGARTSSAPVEFQHRAMAAVGGAKPRRLIWAVAFLGVAALTVAIWRPWQKPLSTERARLAGQSGRSESLTETQKLLAQAKQLIEQGDELNRENYFFAEDLVKRAVQTDPAEPSAWALHARLSYLLLWHNIDVSEARRDAMRRQAERARALAPDSSEVLVIVADVKIQLRENLNEVESDLVKLTAREPHNWRARRSLGALYRFTGRPDEAITRYQRARELSGGSVVADGDLVNALMRAGRQSEAEVEVNQALARHKSGRLLCFAQFLHTQWRGDLVAARAALETWPDWLRVDDRGAILSWRTWMWSKRFDQALAVTQRLQRDYLRDTYFIGPRAVLSAMSHEGAGHAEAAQADWRLALNVAERELASSPTDISATFWKAWSLARLGDRVAAQAICAQLEQRNQLAPSDDNRMGLNRLRTAVYFGSPAGAALWAVVGRSDLALSELRKAKAARFFSSDYFPLTRAMLELDPAFDTLRTEPEFTAILAAAPTPEKQPAVPADQKSIAVLAFENRSSEKDSEYFSDGITEEVLNVLAKVPGLIVLGRSSSFQFKGKSAAPDEIARKLNVTHLVEGSVQRIGSRARITAQLTLAVTGDTIWSDKFDTDLKDIFAAQDDIAGKITQALQLKLGGAARPAQTVNPEAHRLVLEGRHFWNLRNDDDLKRSEEKFTKAVEIDPQFAAAHAGLADANVMIALYSLADGAKDVQQHLNRGRAAACRAGQLDPSLPEPFGALAYAAAIEGDLENAERNISRAIVLNPNHPTAHQWRGVFLARMGRLDEALKEFELGVQLDPLSFVHQWILGEGLMFAGREAAALIVLERAEPLRSTLFIPHLAERALAQLKAGHRAEAIAAARTIRASWPATTRWWGDGYAVWILRQAGQGAEADAYANEILAKLPAESYQRGVVLAACDRFDEALPFLERTPHVARRILFWSGLFDRYRTDARFERLMATLGCLDDYKRARETLARVRQQSPAKK